MEVALRVALHKQRTSTVACRTAAFDVMHCGEVNMEWMKTARLLCVLVMMMPTIVSYSSALDGNVEDAVAYWERRFYGAELLPSLRAMVTPLSTSEATQLTNNIAGGAGGEYLRLHAAQFCERAHIHCALDNQSEALWKDNARQIVRKLPNPHLLAADENSPHPRTGHSKLSNKYAEDAAPESTNFQADPGKAVIYHRRIRAGDSTPHITNAGEAAAQNIPSNYRLVRVKDRGYSKNDKDSRFNKDAKEATDEDARCVLYGKDATRVSGERCDDHDMDVEEAADENALFGFNGENAKESADENALFGFYGKDVDEAAEENALFGFYGENGKEAADENALFGFYGENAEEAADENALFGFSGQDVEEAADENALFGFYGKNAEEAADEDRIISSKNAGQTGIPAAGKTVLMSHPFKPATHRRYLALHGSKHVISRNTHMLTSVGFRERQILVKGIEFREMYGIYGRDDVYEKAAGRAFLPRSLAKLFSLAGQKTRNVNLLGVSDQDLQQLVRKCETKIDDEDRKCVNSVEDLADFVTEQLGVTPDAKITTYESITDAGHVQRHDSGDTFHVLNVKNLTGDSDPSVICHDMLFPFRTFLCHPLSKNIKTFLVSLQGENGRIHERVAACHCHRKWGFSPAYYRILEAKPGDEIEICHWLGGMSLKLRAYVFVRETALNQLLASIM